MKWQIDELVVQAFELKATSTQGRKEIESFTHFLSEMASSLKVTSPGVSPRISTYVHYFPDIGSLSSQNAAMVSQNSEGAPQPSRGI